MKNGCISLLLLVLLSACSKEVTNNRALNGDWKPVDFSLFNYDGLKTKPNCNGTISFNPDGKKSKTGTYNFNLLFDFNGSPLNFIEQGTYQIENKNVMTLFSDENDEQTPATIVYTTKEDLILEIPNKNYLGYYIVLKK